MPEPAPGEVTGEATGLTAGGMVTAEDVGLTLEKVKLTDLDQSKRVEVGK